MHTHGFCQYASSTLNQAWALCVLPWLACSLTDTLAIINMIVFVCAPWGNWAIYLAWGLWWVDVAMSCATSLTIPFIM